MDLAHAIALPIINTLYNATLLDWILVGRGFVEQGKVLFIRLSRKQIFFAVLLPLLMPFVYAKYVSNPLTTFSNILNHNFACFRAVTIRPAAELRAFETSFGPAWPTSAPERARKETAS